MQTTAYAIHNLFRQDLARFYWNDPHLSALSQLKYQAHNDWWRAISMDTPGIYILTGGRQIGKSTSCKLLIKHCLEPQLIPPDNIFYLPCDEIFDAKEFSQVLRSFLDNVSGTHFLLIVDEVTFVKDWDRVIKALADEGCFQQGICILTGSDALILRDAAQRFPGRRGNAAQTDFHLFPLTFAQYTELRAADSASEQADLFTLFQEYLQCGGYLRAINDLAQTGQIAQATYSTYEQWIRGDLLKQGKHEDYLLRIFQALLTVGSSQVSYSKLTQKMGLMAKDTCIDYLRILARMDVLIELQAYDQNKKQGFPRKERKFHFCDPFIQQTVYRWVVREGYLNQLNLESSLVEATVANHCHRLGKTFYFKGQGEVDVIWLIAQSVQAIEVKWAEQLRATDLKTLKHFDSKTILTKKPQAGIIEGIRAMSVYQFLQDPQVICGK